MGSAHDTAVLPSSEFESATTCRDSSLEDAFVREHGLGLVVEETERLAREQFGCAFRDLQGAVTIDGDFGTEYLHVSVLIDSDVDTLLDAEPAFFAALASQVPCADWSLILVSLRLARDAD